MWATLYVSPPRPLIPVLHKPAKTPRSPPSLAASAGESQPPAATDVGGLGRTILTALESNSNPKPTDTIPIPQKQKPMPEEEEEEEKQISGSDVLWALKKAAAKKNGSSGNKKKKKASVHREEVAGDYSDVRPLRVKGEWSGKLDELEKRLRELSHTK